MSNSNISTFMTNINTINIDNTQYTIGPEITDLDYSKLIPENIRKGITLFEGTEHEVVGSLTYLDLIPDDIDLFDGEDMNPIIGKMKLFSGSTSSQPYINNGSIFIPAPLAPSGVVTSIFSFVWAFDSTKYDELTINYSGSITWNRPISIGYVDSKESFISIETHKVDGSFSSSVTINLSDISDYIRPAISITRSNSESVSASISLMVLKKYKI